MINTVNKTVKNDGDSTMLTARQYDSEAQNYDDET